MVQSSLVLALVLESLYASGEVPTVPLYQAVSSAAFSSAMLSQQPTSAEVPTASFSSEAVVVPPPIIQSSASSTSTSSVHSVSSSISSLTPEEQAVEDGKVLSDLEAFSSPDEKTLEEQQALLRQGFTVTGTSTLGNPLPASQREAILRSDIQTFDQLVLFAKALAESDEHLRKFVVNDESIEMTYRASAKLFGFIPMSHLVTVTLGYDGTVVVNGPWWLLFASDTIDDATQAMQGLTGALEEASIAQESRKFTTISNVLRAMLEAM